MDLTNKTLNDISDEKTDIIKCSNIKTTKIDSDKIDKLKPGLKSIEDKIESFVISPESKENIPFKKIDSDKKTKISQKFKALKFKPSLSNSTDKTKKQPVSSKIKKKIRSLFSVKSTLPFTEIKKMYFIRYGEDLENYLKMDFISIIKNVNGIIISKNKKFCTLLDRYELKLSNEEKSAEKNVKGIGTFVFSRRKSDNDEQKIFENSIKESKKKKKENEIRNEFFRKAHREKFVYETKSSDGIESSNFETFVEKHRKNDKNKINRKLFISEHLIDSFIAENKKIPNEYQNGIELERLYESVTDIQCASFLNFFVSQCEKFEFLIILNELITHFPILMCHSVSNRLCQKIFQLCDQSQMSMVIDMIKNSIHELSCNQNASFVLQKMISSIFSKENRELIITNLKNPQHILMMVDSESGIYVIFSLLDNFPFTEVSFLVEFAVNYFYSLSKTKSGVRFIKRCILQCIASEKEKKDFYNRLIDCTVKYSRELIMKICGRFILKCILDTGHTSDHKRLHRQFKGNYCSYAKNNISSNVLESLLLKSNWQIRSEIVEELVDDSEFGLLVCHENGNIIVQKILECCLRTQIPKVIHIISPYILCLNDTERIKWNEIIKQYEKRMSLKDRYVSNTNRCLK